MQNKHRILSVVLIVAVLAALFPVVRGWNEPKYQGKRLSFWLKQMEDWDGDSNNMAFVAFHGMGTNAIPSLLSILQSGGGHFGRTLIKLDVNQSFVVRHLYGNTWERTTAASWALYAMGPNARSALPVLTNLLFTSNATIEAANALAGIGSDAVIFLLLALTNQNQGIRYAAASSLGWERSDFKILVPALTNGLHDPGQYVRYAVVTSLGQLHAEPDIAVPALTNSFAGSDLLLRSLVLDSLGKFGRQARAAIPMIVDALNDTNVSYNAALALKKIDPEAAAKAGLK